MAAVQYSPEVWYSCEKLVPSQRSKWPVASAKWMSKPMMPLRAERTFLSNASPLLLQIEVRSPQDMIQPPMQLPNSKCVALSIPALHGV